MFFKCSIIQYYTKKCTNTKIGVFLKCKILIRSVNALIILHNLFYIYCY